MRPSPALVSVRRTKTCLWLGCEPAGAGLLKVTSSLIICRIVEECREPAS